MDHIGLRRSDSGVIDMENGGKLSEDDDDVQVQQLVGNAAKKKLGRLRSGSLAESIGSTGDLNSIEEGLSSGEKLKILVSQVTDEVENKMVKDKRKQKNSMKPPKPPRPPRDPSWEIADMDFVREISELARSKHARNERLKALKMKRAEKASSPSSGIDIFAMFITILFFLVIIFQGFLGSWV